MFVAGRLGRPFRGTFLYLSRGAAEIRLPLYLVLRLPGFHAALHGKRNKLFPEEYRVDVAADGTLPTDVRIFALMRLGIKDSVIVANYLNLSLNTVYVYKAKVKSRSMVKKEDFEACIMQIPKL